tara:strand:+ start:10376 stop:10561 length:186 start_codon:yes stop_codon:yes gene_type:complete
MSRHFKVEVKGTFFAYEQDSVEGAKENIMSNVHVRDLHDMILESFAIEIDEHGNEIREESK